MLSIGSIRVTVPSYSLLNSMLQQKSTLSDNDKAIHCDSWIFNKFFVTFYTKSFYAGMACLGPNLDRFIWLDLKFRAILGTSCLYHGALDLSWISDKSKIIEKLWVYAPKPQQPTLPPRKPTKQQKKSKAKIKTQPPCFVLCPFFFFFFNSMKHYILYFRHVHVWVMGKWLFIAQSTFSFFLPSSSLFLPIVHIFSPLNDWRRISKRMNFLSIYVSFSSTHYSPQLLLPFF